MNRICKVCKMYFASQVMLRKHDMQHKHQADQVLSMPLIRPVLIAARRQSELMAVITLRESQDIEWVHEDLLDITEIIVIIIIGIRSVSASEDVIGDPSRPGTNNNELLDPRREERENVMGKADQFPF